MKKPKKLLPAPAGCDWKCRSKCRSKSQGKCDCRSACQSRQAGFTLIELMLALSLTALLLGMLSAGVYSVVRDWDDNAAALDASLDETITLLQIERALQGAFPHSFRDPDSLGRFIFFEGEVEQLAWVSTVSPQREGGLMAWRLFNEPDEGVYLQLAPALSDYPGERLDDADSLLLLPGYEASFSYLREELDFNQQWTDGWDGEQQMVLPLAIHVLLTPLDAGRVGLEILAPVFANQHRSLQPAQVTPGVPISSSGRTQPGAGLASLNALLEALE